MRLVLTVSILALLFAACGSPSDVGADLITPSDDVSAGTDANTPGSTAPDRGEPNVERAPQPLPPVVDQVPDPVLEPIIMDAADRTGTAPENQHISRAEAIVWPDGSLGCPEPGEFYTQALVDGFWIEIRTADTSLDYRVDGAGNFKLCAGQTTPHAGQDGGFTYGSGEKIGPPGGGEDS